MYWSFRHLVALIAVAVAFVGVALAYRISRALPEHFPAPASHTVESSLKAPDASFYDSMTPTPSPSVSSPANDQSIAAPSPQGPYISAESYLVGDVATGKVYLERNASEVLPVASMSKLITAIAATDTIRPTEKITITPEDYAVASDTSMISSGETFTMNELLYPMLLNSSNVAAEALASTKNRTKFLELMSSYAWEIGMSATFFADPSGLNPKNISTARDFFALAQYLYKNRPDILAITRTVASSTATTTDHGSHNFVSIHPFVSDPTFLGGKTGHTPEARDTMLTILNIAGQPIAVVVLSSDNRKADTDTLVELFKQASP